MARLSGLRVEFGGKTAIGDKPGKGASRIRKAAKRSPILPGDTIVLLDVGEHSCDPGVHEGHWRDLVSAADIPGVRVLVCEGFDAGARGNPACQYDTPFNGRTMNEAIRSAANGAEWLPLSEPIKAYCAQMGQFGRNGFLFDEIHPDVFCQLRICRLILGALGADLRGRSALRAMVLKHWKTLRAPSRDAAHAMTSLALE